MKQNVELVFNCGEFKQILILPETPIKVVFTFNNEKELRLREQKGKPGLYEIYFQRGFSKATGVESEKSQIQKELYSNKTLANAALPLNLGLTKALQFQNSNEDFGKERSTKETFIPKISEVISFSSTQLKNSNEVCSQVKPLYFSLPSNSTSITPDNYHLQNSSEICCKGKPLNAISLPRNSTIITNSLQLQNSQNICVKENPLNITKAPKISTFICSSNFQLQNLKTVCDKDRTPNITLLPKNLAFSSSNDFQLQNSEESFSKENIANVTSPLPITSRLINLNDLLLQNSVVLPAQSSHITGYGEQNKFNIDKNPGEKCEIDDLQRSPVNKKKLCVGVVYLGKHEQNFQTQQSRQVVYDETGEQAEYKTSFKSKAYNLHHNQSGECAKELQCVPIGFSQSTDSANQDICDLTINTSSVSQSEEQFCDTQNYDQLEKEFGTEDSRNILYLKRHEKCAFCSCYRRDKPGTRFHRFPTSPTRSKKWAEISGKKWVINATHARRSSFKICADHFRPSDYCSPVSRRLHLDAVPSFFYSRDGNVAETLKEKLKKALNTRLPVKAKEDISSSTSDVAETLKEKLKSDLNLPVRAEEDHSSSITDMSETLKEKLKKALNTPLPVEAKEDLSSSKTGPIVEDNG